MATHRKGTDNLEKPWAPGTSGNPNGMKKGTKHGFRTVLRRRLRYAVPEEALKTCDKFLVGLKGKTGADVIVAHLMEMAMNSDDEKIRVQAMALITKHADPPEVQKTALTDPEGERPYGEATAAELVDIVKKAMNGKGNGK